MRLIHSIKFRFTLWYLVILGILLGSLSVGLYFYLLRTLRQNLDDSLRLRAEQLSHIRDILMTVREGRFEEQIGEVISLYFLSDGDLLYLSPEELDLPISNEMIEQAMNGQSSFATIETAEGRELRVYLRPISPDIPPFDIPLPPGSPERPAPSLVSPPVITSQPAALVIGRSTEPIKEALGGLIRTLGIAVPLTLAFAAGGGFFLARRALKPVDQIAQQAQTIEETDLSQRIEVKAKDELGRLASTLNEMIDRLEKAFKRQQQFTSDASHELRTPLAIIEAESTLMLQKDRTNSEYRQSLETISQEAHRIAHLVDQLLTLARADAGKEKFSLKEVNLNELIRELSSDVEILCRDKGLEFKLNQTEDLVVNGDDAKLRQLFLNLLDNAIRYTPSGGSISVSVYREGQMAVVAVSDSGIGISQEDLPHIFDRFYRVDKARSPSKGGSGLGLAICKQIAEGHRGRIEVQSEFGRGSTFSVFLPLYE